MIYIIGGNGFVGSAFVRLFRRKNITYQIIDRDNHRFFRDKPCDILINANGNSKKFLADRDVVTEFDASTRSVLVSLTSFNYNRYIYLSSGDVYPEQDTPASTKESLIIDVNRQSRYGLHKYLSEQLVRKYSTNWLIMRMGGFVGPGLKKNAIFDMLSNSTVWLSPESELQFIHTDSAAEIVWELILKNVSNEVVNLGASGVVNIGALHAQIRSISKFHEDAHTKRFELSLEKLHTLLGRELPSSEHEVARFVTDWPDVSNYNFC